MSFIEQQLSLPVPHSQVLSFQAMESTNPDLGRFYRTFLCASLPRMDEYDRVRVCNFKIWPFSSPFNLDDRYTTGVKAIAISLPPQFEPHLGDLSVQMPQMDFPFSQCCRGIHRRLRWFPPEDAVQQGCFEFAIKFAWVEDTHFPDEVRRNTVLGDGDFALYLLFWQPVIFFAGDSVATGGFWMSDVQRESAMYTFHTSANFNPWRHLPYSEAEIEEKMRLYKEDPLKWNFSFEGASGRVGYVARMPDASGFDEAAEALAAAAPAEEGTYELI